MKLRYLLLAPTLLLGLLLVLFAGLRFQDQLAMLRGAQALDSSDLVRANLLLTSAALGTERLESYGRLVATADPQSLADAQVLTDQRVAEALAVIAENRRMAPAVQTSRTVDSLTGGLAAVRATVAEALTFASGSEVQQATARRVFDGIGEIIEGERGLRLRLLRTESTSSARLQAQGRMRYYSSLLEEAISQNEALLAGILAGGPVSDWAVARVIDNVGRGELALSLMRSEADVADVGAAFARLDISARGHFDGFEPALTGSDIPISDQIQAETGQRGVASARATLADIVRIQTELLALSREGVAMELRQAHLGLLTSGLVMALSVFAVLASYLLTRRRLVRPLEDTIGAMMRLAAQDLETPLPDHRRADEFAAMVHALRVFKANAVRRERLAKGQRRLHMRLRESYRSLREDLRAAAAIQTTLLPAPGRIAELEFCGLYRPASVVAGDTFNVLQQADGSVGFFQVDVAGHGAPAALGSVVSHHHLSQTIVKRTDDMPLSAIAGRIDLEWPEDLPYFTMIFGEVCLRRSRLQFVQAGHPPPIVIRRDGTMETLGDGGLPVGLVPGSQYEVTQTRFAEGDRLLVYSDGVSEAADPDGELFGHERLLETIASDVDANGARILAMVLEAVRRWRQVDGLDDDVSLLLLENRRVSSGTRRD